jgi:large subunit ribosomal protein L33
MPGSERGLPTAFIRFPGGFPMREYVWLECTVCSARNYRTQKETRGADRLALKKFCRKERKHTPHKESRKK